MFRATLRNVLAHRARLLMTVLAVLLGVAFVAGTLIFTDSVSAAYTRSAEKSFTGIDVQLRPAVNPGGHDTRRLLGSATLDQARALPGAASVTGVAAGFTALAGKDGELVGEGFTTAGANHDGDRHPITAGAPPRAEGEIAVDATTAARTGYAVGDTVRLSVDGPVREEKVTGIFTTEDGNVSAGGTLTLFDTATAQRLFAEPGHYNRIELTAAPGTTPERLQRQAERIVPPGVEAITADALAAEQTATNAADFDLLAKVLLACAGIALFVGIFLIVNTFTMLVAQRTRELALLRAVGATRRQVTRSVLAEAALVGSVAAAGGLAAGIGAGAGVRAVLSATGGTVPDGPLVVSPVALLVAPALGVGVTLIAAWLPARRAARIPPVAAMSAVHTPATARSLVVRNTIGAAVAAAGAVVVVVATTMTDGELVLGAGAVVLLVGVFVLTPLLSRPVVAAAGPVLRRFGVTGKLARQNAVRNPRRTAATAAALTVGLTLIAALNVIGASADKAVHDLAASDFMRGDYLVTMANAGPLAPDADDKLRALAEVTAVSPRREIPARVDGVPQTVSGFHTADVDRLLDMGMTEGGFAPGKTAVVDEETARAEGWTLGDTVEITWPDGVREPLELTGLYSRSFDAGLKTDISLMDPHLDSDAEAEIFVKTADGASEQAIRDALGGSPAIRIKGKDALTADITGAIALVLNILYGMLALAVVVAVLGVVNTMAMSVHERAQEIGLLRAVGLNRPGVKRMVRLESVVISLFGGVLGVGLGVFFGWAVGELVATVGIDTWTLVLPWGRLALLLAAAVLVGVLAALWPARRAARLNVLDAIRTE
jgi:putative ABC transport system permease protein